MGKLTYAPPCFNTLKTKEKEICYLFVDLASLFVLLCV